MPIQKNKHPGIKRLESGKYQARARVSPEKELSKVFEKISDAKDWQASIREARRKGETRGVVDNRLTFAEWSEKWLKGQEANRRSSYRQAKTHVKRINVFFGARRLTTIQPSDVREWIGELKDEGLADSTISALHSRLSSIMWDAVHDGLLTRNPCSRRTAPAKGKAKTYVCTPQQVWELYEAMPGLYGNAVLLAAYAGLRRAEAVAVHPVRDVDWVHGTLTLHRQYGDAPLKTDAAGNEIVVPLQVLAKLRESLAPWKDPESLVLSEWGRMPTPDRLGVHFKAAIERVGGLPEGFSFHDLRHFYASTLIAARLDIKTIQHQMRHEKPSTTLNVYGHMMEGKKESARAAIAEAFAAHADFLRSSGDLGPESS